MVPHAADHPVELLAPAGDFDAMRAAVANGADAVYFGLSNFNARHRAANFTTEELPKVMAYLHEHNVKGYITFNTLIFSDELPDAVRFATAIAKAGVDAAIVQDLGLARLLHRLAPTMPLHGSTQMTLTEPRGIDLVATLGVSRVILARELSIAEIGQIAQATRTPLEVFVHGALCVAYSGQCLTSESLGGRSANRGQCAQACRLPYELIVDGQPRDLGDRAYLLSPQDLAGYDRIGDLVSVGVQSFKIEGRLKSAHYVAATTQTYRSAIDAAAGHQSFQIAPQQKSDLQQSFSRGFTPGFLDGVNHQQLVPARFPKSRGIHVGTVAGKTPTGVVIETRGSGASLKPGDGIVFDEGHPEQDEQGGRVFFVKQLGSPRRLEITLGRGDVNLSAVAIGSMVWKTDDPAVRRRLEQTWSRENVVHRTPLYFRVRAILGEPLSISVRDDRQHEAAVTWDQPLQRAEKHPLTAELPREQFSRLGSTPFELAAVELDAPEPVMVPKSVLNDLRRRAVEQLMQSRAMRHPIAQSDALDQLRKEITSPNFQNSGIRNQTSNLTVLVRSIEQLRAVLDWSPAANLSRPSLVYCDFEDVRRYKDAIPLARAGGLPIALGTIRIVKPHEAGLLKLIADAGPDAILVRNLAAICFFREACPGVPLIGDYSLNIANELTAAFFAEQGLKRMVPSYDLNWPQLAAMIRRFPPAMLECVVHQHMPMFHNEHCVFAATLSNGKDFRDCGRPCETHKVELRDRVGMAHPLLADVGCRNTLFNATAQSAADFVPRMKDLGIAHYRIELVRETPDDAIRLVERYARLIAGLESPPALRRQLKVLNQLGVTAGTLEFD